MSRFCQAVQPVTGLHCQGLPGHTGPHAAYDAGRGFTVTWERHGGRRVQGGRPVAPFYRFVEKLEAEDR